MTEHAAPPDSYPSTGTAPSDPSANSGAMPHDGAMPTVSHALPLREGGPARGSVLARLTREPLVLVALCVFVGLGSRLYGANLAYPSDEGYWLHRTVVSGNAVLNGEFATTFRSGHPGVTVMWAGLLGIGPERVRTFAGEQSRTAPGLEAAPGALRLMSLARTAVSMLAAGLFGLAVV